MRRIARNIDLKAMLRDDRTKESYNRRLMDLSLKYCGTCSMPKNDAATPLPTHSETAMTRMKVVPSMEVVLKGIHISLYVPSATSIISFNILFTYNHASLDDTHHNINTWWHCIDLCTHTFWVHYLTFTQSALDSTTTDPLTPSLCAVWCVCTHCRN
jgi:hypothetical protein